MNTKRWIALLIVIVLAVGSLGVRFITTFTSNVLSEQFDITDNVLEEEILIDGDAGEKVAVLSLIGTIENVAASPFGAEGYDHSLFLHMIDTAAEDPTVNAIVLEVDSPGGTVPETAEIHRKIVELQQDYDKPIYVSMGSMAASGGYYVSAPADKIFAESSTLTGSIGVIMESINVAGLAEKYGIEFNTIKSGKHKDIMSPSREMTEEEHEIMQSMIDEMYDEFVDIIVDGRDLSESHVREIGDGRIYTGKQAIEVGLVDEIGSRDDTIFQMIDDYGLQDPQVVQYGYGLGYFSNFFMTANNFINGGNDELDTVMKLIEGSDQPRAMYIY